MSNEVYANGNEVSCKAAAGKSTAAFPDVCFTPPQTPATPPGVPIPYPNTGMASDTSSGSKTVQISGQEVMLKDSSFFKQSTGDEAGSAPKKNVITSVIQGKCYYTAWSMDVKIEGENAVRHLDMMTHNHASGPGATPPWPYMDSMARGDDPCETEKDNEARECAGSHSGPGGCTEECKKAKACKLIPKSDDKTECCHPDNTGHHMIEDHWVKNNPNFAWYGAGGSGSPQYEAAPTTCVNAKRSEEDHQSFHNVQGAYEESFLPATATRPAGVNSDRPFTYGEGKRASLNAHDATTGGHCSRECMEGQLDNYYGADQDDRPLNQPRRRQPLGTPARTQTNAHWSGSIGS